MRFMKFALAAPAVATLALTACQPAQTDQPADAESPAAEAGALARDVVVTLTPAASARLAETSERITVSAFWYGRAAPGVPAHEDGTVSFADEQVTLPATGGSARLAGADVQPAEGQIEGPVMLNINVFSAREGNPDNLLDCGIYDAAAEAAPNPIELSCGLIGETSN